MSRLTALIILVLTLAVASGQSQEFSARARILAGQSDLRDNGGAVEMRLGLSQGVPYRVFSLDNPRRIVLDFNEVDWAGLTPQAFDNSSIITGYRVGVIKPGWSRMVLDLGMPMAVQSAGMKTSDDGTTQVDLRLVPTGSDGFSETAGTPDSALFASRIGPPPAVQAPRRQTGERPLVVVLDPGHGGIDPGAERDGAVEADLMLAFARELKEILLRAGKFDVVLTRNEDEFVPLEARVSFARRAGADIFLSLHADALVEGRASGSTIYTLSERASDVASQKLAERHDRADLLAGVDLSNQDDVIAGVLMDLARTETTPRTDSLADALVTGLSNTVGMHKRPRLSAGFSVLKAPDIPSVLLELGFLSSQRDRDRLLDADWRKQAALGIRNALLDWSVSDAADALLLRK